eukprot:Sspe_Gene.55190::Locus_30381_Transcript_2_2_Confidence_0.667_Length_1122::g.55190::m.55190
MPPSKGSSYAGSGDWSPRLTRRISAKPMTVKREEVQEEHHDEDRRLYREDSWRSGTVAGIDQRRKCALHGSVRSQPYMIEIAAEVWTCRADDVCRTSVQDRLSFSMRDPENAEALRRILQQAGGPQSGVCPIKLAEVLHIRAVDPPTDSSGVSRLCWTWLTRRECAAHGCPFAHEEAELDFPRSQGLSQLLMLLRLPLVSPPPQQLAWTRDGQSQRTLAALDVEEERLISQAVEQLDPEDPSSLEAGASALLKLQRKPHAAAETILRQLDRYPGDCGKLLQVIYMVALATTSPTEQQAALRVADGFRRHLRGMCQEAMRLAGK